MKTLSRNIKNDIYIEKGGLALSEDAEAKCDIIESIVLTQQGELQFDPEGGVDYFGSVFQSAQYIDLWAAQVRTIIEALDWVQSVENFEYHFDAPTSSLYWSMEVLSVDGERLDIKDKKRKSDDTLDVKIKWDTIYNKENVDTARKSMAKMIAARNSAPYSDKDGLANNATLQNLKNGVNDIILLPNGSGDHDASDDIRVYLAGMDKNQTVKFSNVKADGEWTVYWGDGTVNHYDQATTETDGHVYSAGGDATVIFVGEIEQIGADQSVRAVERSTSSFVNVPRRVIGFSAGSETILKKLGADTFCGCSSLVAVAIGAEVTTIGDHCFDGCSALSDLKWIPPTVSAIGEYAFTGCSSLVSLEGLQGTQCQQIPTGCFKDCVRLKSAVHFPSIVGIIGESAFEGCTSITTVFIRDGVYEIGDKAFPTDSIVNVRWDAPVEATIDFDYNFPQRKKTLHLYVPEGNVSLFVDDWDKDSLLVHGYGDLLLSHSVVGLPRVRVGETSNIVSACVWTVDNGDGTEEVLLPWENTIPAHVYAEVEEYLNVQIFGYLTRIEAAGTYAFPIVSFGDKGTNKWLTSVIISEGMSDTLDAIGTACFCGCSALEEVAAPNTVVVGGEMAFFGCDSLQSVAFVKDFAAGASNCFSNCNGLGSGMWSGASSSSITNIPAGCFQNCDNITLDGAPDSITSIGEYAFSESGIETLEGFPSGVTEVGVGCFLLCDKLTDISRLANATGLKRLPEMCFSDCTELTSLKGTANITYIGEECFYNCGITSLEGLLSTVPNSQNDWLEIDDSAFAYTKVKDTSFLPMATKKMGAFVFDGTEMSRVVITSTVPAAITPETFAGIYSTAEDEDEVPIYVRPGFLQVYKSAPVWSSLNLRENGITFYVIAGTPNGGINIGSISLGTSQDITVIWGVKGNVAVASPTNNIVSTGEGYVTPSVNEPVTVMGDVTTIESFTTSAALVSISCARHLPLTSIAANCFKDCTNLVYAGLSFADNSNSDNNSATTIGASAFQGCDNLVEVDIRDSENSPRAIGNFAFSGCESLIRIGYGGGGQDEYAAAELANLQAIGDNAFAGCVALGTFPKLPSVTSIGENAFEGCTALVDINGIGNAISNIEAAAFTGCYNIASVTMTKDTAPTLADSGFDDDTYASAFLYVPAKSLEAYRKAEGWKKFYRNHILPHGITFRLESAATMEVAGDTGFVDADGEWTIDWGDGKVETLEGSAYIPAHSYEGGDSTRYVTLKGHITQIRSAAESAPFLAEANATTHTHLTAFYASHDMGLEAIGARTFYGCTNLAEVLLAGNTVVSLGQYAFYGCTALTTENIVGLEAVQEIPPYGFAGCTGITTLDFMPYIAEVGNGGFYGCTGLVEANTLPLETISPFAFCNCSSLLRTPDCVSNYGGDSDSDSSVLGEGDETIEPYSITIGGGAFSGCSSLAELGTMDAVTEIGNNAFGGCVALNDLRELANVTTINPNAFKGCTGLTSLAVFENVTTIGDEAFRGCTRLTSLLGLGNVNSIGEYAFAECENIESISDLGAGIVRIGDFAFLGVGGDTEKFPEIRMKAVTPPVIGEHTFASMDKSAVKVYVPLPSVADYRNDMLWGGRPINYWSEFANIDAAQTLRFKLTNIPEKGLTVSGRNAQIVIEPLNTASPVYDPTTGQTIVVMNTYSQWFVDWGDGSQVEEYDAAQTAMPSHRYSGEFSEAVITISGNVKEIGTVSDTLPFLFDENATAEEGNPIEFPYLVGFTVSDDVPLDGIGANCFVNCTELSNIILPQKAEEEETARSDDEDVFEIGDYAFANTGVTSLKFLPANTRLNDGVFANCKKLVSLEGWPQKLTTVPAHTFSGCTSVTEITNLEKVTILGDYAFYNTGVRVFSLGGGGTFETVPTIGEYSFASPSTVEERYFTPVAYVTLLNDFEYDDVPDLPASSFASHIGTNGVEADRVPVLDIANVSSDTAGYFTAKGWDNSFYILTEADAVTYTLKDVPAKATVWHLLGNASSETYPFGYIIEWGDGARGIYQTGDTTAEHTYAEGGDYNVTVLSKVTGLYGITTGGQYGQGWLSQQSGQSRKAGCQWLASVEFGTAAASAITAIGNGFFAHCPMLKDLATFSNIKRFESYAFYGCTDLVAGDVFGAQLEYIGQNAFATTNDTINIKDAVLTVNKGTPPDVFVNTTDDTSAFGGNGVSHSLPYSLPKLVVPIAASYQSSNWNLIFTNIESMTGAAVLVIEIPSPTRSAMQDGRRDTTYTVTYTGPNTIAYWGEDEDSTSETTQSETNDQGNNPSGDSYSGDSYSSSTTPTEPTQPEEGSSADAGSSSAPGEIEPSSDVGGGMDSGSGTDNTGSDSTDSDYTSSDFGGSSSYGGEIDESLESESAWDSSVPIDESIVSTDSDAVESTADSPVYRDYGWLHRADSSTDQFWDYAAPGVYAIRIVPSSNTDTTLTGTWIFPEDTKVLQLTIEQSCKFTSIGEGFCRGPNFTFLESVIIKNQLAKIQPSAFDGCTGLLTCALPSSLTTIGAWAFRGCSNLSSVSLPAGLSTLGENAFANCTTLDTVVIPMENCTIGPSENKHEIFSGCNAIARIELGQAVLGAGVGNVFPTLMSETYTQNGQKKVGASVTIVLPQDITALPDEVFKNVVRMEGVQLPTTLTTIGMGAFEGCSRLSSIVLPKNLSTIGARAFVDCARLPQIDIPDGVTLIGITPFAGCDSLKEVAVGENVQNIGLRTVFAKDQEESPSDSNGESGYSDEAKLVEVLPIEKITLRNCIGLPDECFAGWTNLVSIVGRAKESKVNIGESAFYGCANLVLLHIKRPTEYGAYQEKGMSVPCEEIGADAFNGCALLPSVSTWILDLKKLGDNAFANCTSLTTVKVNLSSDTEVGFGVFAKSNNVEWNTTVKGLEGVRMLSNWAFGAEEDCALTTLDFRKDIDKEVYGIAPEAFADHEGLKASVTNVYLGKSGNVQATVRTATAIGARAFAGFENVTTVFADDYCHPITNNNWGKADASTYNTPFLGWDSVETAWLGESACAVPMAELLPNCYASSLERVILDPKAEPTIGNRATFAGCGNVWSVRVNQFVTTSATLHSFFPDSNLTFCRFRPEVTYIRPDFLSGSGCTHIGVETPTTQKTAWVEGCLPALIGVITQVTLAPEETWNRCVVGTEAFKGCTKLKYVKLADTAKDAPIDVGISSFQNCTALTSFSANLTSVGANGFNGCTALKNLSAPWLTSIGESAFAGCTALVEMSGLKKVATIGTKAFNGCKKLNSLKGLSSTLVRVGDYAFQNTACGAVLKNVPAPDCGKYLFQGVAGTIYAPKDSLLSLSVWQTTKPWYQKVGAPSTGNTTPTTTTEYSSEFAAVFGPENVWQATTASHTLAYPAKEIQYYTQQGQSYTNATGSVTRTSVSPLGRKGLFGSNYPNVVMASY